MSEHPNELRQALLDYAQQMRDDYARRLHTRVGWILPAHVYDEAQRQIEAGTALPGVILVMRNAVREEEMNGREFPEKHARKG